MNRKAEIDKLVQIKICHALLTKQLEMQKDIVRSLCVEEGLFCGHTDRISIIKREFQRFNIKQFREKEPEKYQDYKTLIIDCVELKPVLESERRSVIKTQFYEMFEEHGLL